MFENKLIPILREGVELIKILLFREIKALAGECFPEGSQDWPGKVSAVVLNDIFATPNLTPEVLAFSQQYNIEITDLFQVLKQNLGQWRIPITDALRITVLCDYQEGRDTSNILATARDKGLLLMERDMPMPHTFIDLVRRLGASANILAPAPQSE